MERPHSSRAPNLVGGGCRDPWTAIALQPRRRTARNRGAALVIGPLVIALGPEHPGPQETTIRPWMPFIALASGIALLFVGGPGGFFGAGALLLIAALLFLLRWLRGIPGNLRDVRALGMRYTAHRPGRSVLCIALIAAATFLIVAIDSFRRDTQTEGPWRCSRNRQSRCITIRVPWRDGTP